MAKEITLDRLAELVVEGFDEVKKEIGTLKSDMKEVKGELKNLNKKTDRLEVEMKNIRTDLKEKADLSDLTALERRVTFLEAQMQGT